VRRWFRVTASIVCVAALLGCFFLLIVSPVAAVEPPTTRYALIVEGWEPYNYNPNIPNDPNQPQRLLWFWGATSGMYDILRNDYGIPRDNIHFLFQDLRWGDTRVTATSTVANLTAALNDLANRMTEDDQLYCFFVDHGYQSGGHSYFSLQDGGISDTWLDGRADAIAALNQTWVFTQCNSGGFATVMAAPDRVISTSTRIDETNAAAYAEPFRDGLHFTSGAAPTVSAAYENALNSMWNDYRTGSRQNSAFKEHCLINDFGAGAGRYGRYLQVGNYVGPDTPYGQSFQLNNFVVSTSQQQVTGSSEVLVRFEFYNPTANNIVFNTVCVGCRDPQGTNRDFGPMSNVTLTAGDSLLFEAQTTVNMLGTWHFWPAYNIGGWWGPYKWHEILLGVDGWVAARDAFIRRLGSRFDCHQGPYYSSVDPALEMTNFAVYGPVLSDTGFARPNDVITVRFTFRNTGATTMTFSSYGIFVGCRDPQGANRDFGHQAETLAPGASVTREATITVDQAGTWTFWPAYYYNGHWGPYMWQSMTLDVYERTLVPRSAGAAYYTVGTQASTGFGTGTVRAAAYGYAVTQVGTSYVWEGQSPITGGWFNACFVSLASLRSFIDGATGTMAPGVRQWWLDVGLPAIGG